MKAGLFAPEAEESAVAPPAIEVRRLRLAELKSQIEQGKYRVSSRALADKLLPAMLDDSWIDFRRKL